MDRYDSDPGCAQNYMQDRDRDAAAWQLSRAVRKTRDGQDEKQAEPLRSTSGWNFGGRLLQALQSLR